MKSIALVTLLGVVGLIGLSQAEEDYCSKTLCQPGETHIACNHSGDFAETCPKNTKLIKVDEAIQKLIVDLHNTFRNEIAGGKVPNYKAAKRMASMTWDKELAKMGEMHAMNCEFEHDECHATKTFKLSGQNLAQSFYSGYEPAITDTLKELIESWYEEKKDANMDVIRKYPKNWSGEDIGHYTVMVNDQNTKVGCGITTFTVEDEDDDSEMDSTLLTCNYAVTNIIDRPVYEEGTPASGCKTGKHPVFKNLCSSKEQYP